MIDIILIVILILFLSLVIYVKYEPSVDELDDRYLIWYRQGRYTGLRQYVTIMKWK